MKSIHCEYCGANDLRKEGEFYVCEYCGSKWEKHSVDEITQKLSAMLDGVKQEKLANARHNLYDATHAEHVSDSAVLNYAREIKKLLPEDFMANFCETAVSGAPNQINAFLNNVNTENKEVYVEFIADFLLRSLESANVLPLKDLITRGLRGGKYTEYITKVENEAEKVKSGIYSPQVPRDVFVAYSSKDGAAVNDIVEFLEENKISCYVALRNLRHGRGAAENYVSNLRTAIHNCRCVVFLSSDNSRDLDCDALKIELPYIKDNEPSMGRIEYLLNEYGSGTSYAAKRILENFFKGQEYCRTKEDLVDRILDYITGDMGAAAEAIVAPQPAATVTPPPIVAKEEIKYCVSCGAKIPVNSKFCSECGGNEFASTKEEYIEKKTERELRLKLEKEYAEKLKAKQKELELSVIKAQEESNAKEESKAQEEITTKEEPAQKPKKVSPLKDFEIEKGVLKKYKGDGGDVVIPSGITSIGYEAFEKCTSITSVTIPAGVTSIESYAFNGCDSLTSVDMPDGIKSIGDYVFNNCGKLEKIEIPNSVTSIGEKAFEWCKSLKFNEYGRCLYIGNAENEYLLLVKAAGKYVSDCKINASTKFIHSSAFYECGSLVSLDIPSGVIDVGAFAFFNCDHLQRIKLPSSVKTIGSSAFSGCLDLMEIKLPSGLKEISRCTFLDCQRLKSAEIPSSVTSIEGHAFANCRSLTTIKYLGTKNQWKAISKKIGIIDWNKNMPNYTVICSGGSLSKSES